jgi:hypothetical protein
MRWKGTPRRKTPPNTAERARDEQLVMIMHLRENMGLTFGQIAPRVNMTRDACIGAYHRLRLAYDPWCDCENPENQDGGMPPLWWRKQDE